MFEQISITKNENYKTVSNINQSITCYCISKQKYKLTDIKRDKEPCIYILIDTKSEEERYYIGQTSNFSRRVIDHENVRKTVFDEIILFVWDSKTHGLTDEIRNKVEANLLKKIMSLDLAVMNKKEENTYSYSDTINSYVSNIVPTLFSMFNMARTETLYNKMTALIEKCNELQANYDEEFASGNKLDCNIVECEKDVIELQKFIEKRKYKLVNSSGLKINKYISDCVIGKAYRDPIKNYEIFKKEYHVDVLYKYLFEGMGCSAIDIEYFDVVRSKGWITSQVLATYGISKKLGILRKSDVSAQDALKYIEELVKLYI